MSDRPPISYEPRPPRTRSWRDDISAEWARFTAGFTRETIVSNLKTLAWVIPLTLLIWIWAEREQVATSKDEPVPFELVNNSPDRVVMLRFPADKNLVLELQGPQGRLQEVLNKLSGANKPQALRIEVPANALELNRETSLDALMLVRQQRIFADNGITVLGCQPPRLLVVVDPVVEHNARIMVPPEIRNVDATFDPPTVKVRGPLSELTRVERNSPGGMLAVYADLHEVQNNKPGTYQLSDVPLRRPADLDPDRVSIVSLPHIRANVTVREADKQLLIRSMPISVDSPDGLLDKYKVVWEHPSAPVLQNITVTGPPETIENMERPEFEPKPKARLEVTQQDALGGERRSRVVKYDLPEGVNVVEEDKNRTIEFRLVDKSTLPPSL
jgi:hypothetical protein